MRRIKEFDIRHIFAIVITLGFLSCSVFVFPASFGRLMEAFRDFGFSFAYEFEQVLGMDWGIVPTVTLMPEIPESGIPLLPSNLSIFSVKLSMWGNALISGQNLQRFFYGFGAGISIFARVSLLLVPLAAILVIVLKRVLFSGTNNDWNRDTMPRRFWSKLSGKVYEPIKRCIARFFMFLVGHSLYYRIWLVIWLYHFNFFSIIVGALAYFSYFSVSFDFVNLYVQFYKLFLDLGVMFDFVPWWCWIPAVIGIYHNIRTKRALSKLRRHEYANRDFLSMLPLVISIYGLMGFGKTKFATDLALSQEVIFRNTALELLLKHDMQFPDFPWIELELNLRQAMEDKAVYSLASCRAWIRSLRKVFEVDPKRKNCFTYDFVRYGAEYNDCLTIVKLWDVLEMYSQLYFIYVIDTSLIVSNYSIRVDKQKIDGGNFPVYGDDFFTTDSSVMEEYSRRSHILDFDVLRLGKKVLEDNPLGGSFEFGTVVMCEADKERGNTPTLEGVKKDDEKANQKNDLFNYSLMLARHPATVDFFPFVRFLMDAQRAGSVGASLRELSMTLTIVDSSPEKYTICGFGFERWLLNPLIRRFKGFYVDQRAKRGDNTLFIHLLKTVMSKIIRYVEKNENLYGYTKLAIELERGTMDGKKEPCLYYMQNKKIYADRYSTDCYGDYFAERSLRSGKGLPDYPEFEATKAKVSELAKENSYMIRDISGVAKGETKQPESNRRKDAGKERGKE